MPELNGEPGVREFPCQRETSVPNADVWRGLTPQGSLGAYLPHLHQSLMRGLAGPTAISVFMIRLLEIGDRIGSIIQSREEDLILNGFLVIDQKLPKASIPSRRVPS